MEKFAGRDLGNNLVLTHVRDVHDVEQFIHCNQLVTGEGAICDRLIHHRPGATLDNYIMVRDERTGEVVSTTCLLPWQINFAGVPLKTAMLEEVVTHPDYRRRGLIRAQIQHFQELVRQNHYDLSIIQGIPNYYRQYGYAYAMDHTRSARLPSYLIPDAPGVDLYGFHSPEREDLPQVAALYRETMSHQAIFVERNQGYWEYLIEHMNRPLILIKRTADQQLLGYLFGHTQDRQFDIQENAILSLDLVPAVLAKLKQEKPGEIQVTGNLADPLFHWVEALGGEVRPPDQWLINLPDPQALIVKIGPVLEKRLKEAGYRHLSADLLINFYRTALRLRFEDNALTRIEEAGFVDASMSAVELADLCIPPDAFIRLVFGYRSIDELKDAWPDVLYRPQSRQLLDILFPKVPSLILMPY